MSRSGMAAVGYLFGVLSATAIPGTVLIPLLADLGFSDSASRAILYRMRSVGALQLSKSGRVGIYRLDGFFAEQYRRIAHEQSVPEFNGYFECLIYEIPESSRTFRDQFRQTAFEQGFAALRPGVLIGLTPPTGELADALNPEGFLIERGTLSADLVVARRMVDKAWNLCALSRAAADLSSRLQDAQRRTDLGSVAGKDALNLLRDLWGEFVLLQIRTPNLPSQLYPDHWQFPAAQERMFAVLRTLVPEARRYAFEVVSRVGGAELLEVDAGQSVPEHGAAAVP